MQNFHQTLTQKYPAYNDWHQTKYHNKIHWGVFGACVFVFCLLGISSIYASDAIPVTQCGVLNQADAMYVLQNDVSSDGSCFIVDAKNISLDLNNKIITYADMDFTGIQNPGFEDGDTENPAVPLGWDLSGAHGNAFRQDYLSKLFFDEYSLKINNMAGDAYAEESVLSSPVDISIPGKYAIVAEVQGGPHNVLDSRLAVEGIDAVCGNSISGMHMSYSGDMMWGIICEFEVIAPVTVKAKIIVKTKNETKNVSLNVDEVDIRPIGFTAFGSITWHRSGYEIKNGSIVQGKSKSVYSPAIKEGVKIHDLKITTNGINSPNISRVWADDKAEIYNNYMEANGKNPLNRQYPFAMIDLSRTTGGNKIYNNTLVNGPQVGILHGQFGSAANPFKSEIYGNTIKTKAMVTNSFAISAASNVDIYDNTIQPIQGHGIGLSSASDEVKIYNNLIEPRTWPCSEYSKYSYPNSAHGIRIKNYGSGVIENLEISNNTIIGKTNPQLSNCYTEVVGITNYLQDDSGGGTSQNVKIHDNDISVETDNYLQQHAIAYKAMGQGEIYNNTFKSNHIIVEMSDEDATGATKYKKFYSNILAKGDNPQGFYTLRYGYFSPRNNNFLDTILQNGADLKNISLGVNNQGVVYSSMTDFGVSWNLKIEVKNSAGQPISDAAIEIRDKDDNVINQSITDAQGFAVADLDEYVYSYKSSTENSYKYYSPYTVKVTKDGYGDSSQSVELTKLTNLPIVLNIPVPDTQAPTTPTGLTATAVSSTQINLSWSASTDNVGVAGYKIYRDGTLVTMSQGHKVTSYSDTGLQPNTAYTYAVSAYDAAGNDSAQSTPLSVTTPAIYKQSDLNQDGKTDQLDFDILKSDFNRTDKPKSDLNQDGIVDSRDLGILMSGWNL